MEVKARRPIVHIFNSSVVSGPERLVLPALAHMELPVSVIFLAEARAPHGAEQPIAFAKSLGLRVEGILVRSRLDFRSILELRKRLIDSGAGIIHCHDVKASTYGRIAILGLKIRCVSTHHGIHGRPDLKSKLYERFYSWFVLKYFDLVVAVSTSDHAELLRRGLDPQKLKCIFNGIARDRIAPEARPSAQAKARAAWFPGEEPRAEILLGVVGRLSAEKDGPRILRVVQKTAALWDGYWRVVFFGSGPEAEAWQAQARRMGLGQRVLWLGYRDTIASELAGLDGLISLSKSEGQPISMIEAGWAGTPVFSTRVGGVVDLIPSPEFGTTVGAAEADQAIAAKLQIFLKDSASRRVMAQNFQARIVEKFGQAEWLKNHENLYLSLFDC